MVTGKLRWNSVKLQMRVGKVHIKFMSRTVVPVPVWGVTPTSTSPAVSYNHTDFTAVAPPCKREQDVLNNNQNKLLETHLVLFHVGWDDSALPR